AAPPPMPDAPEPAAVDPTVFDDFRAPGIAAGANEFVASLIDQFLTKATSRLRELQSAAQKTDGPDLKRTAHRLKGSAAMVGARGMASLCEQLEQIAVSKSFDRAPELITSLQKEYIRVQHALERERRGAA